MGNDLEQSADGDGASARQLGRRLKKHREYLGMSQQYVAECTGIPRSAVSEIEHGNRRVDAVELTKLADLTQLAEFADFLAARRAAREQDRPPEERR